MFTPPNNGGPSFPPASIPTQHRRRGGLPPRSSLSNSFNVHPSTPARATYHNSPRNSPFAAEDASSFFGPPNPLKEKMAEEGQRGMLSISPRSRPSKRGEGLMAGREAPVRSRLGEESFAMEVTASPIRHSNGAGAEEGREDERSWGMVDSMRIWRHDAMIQHLYETAAFWGDKILSWTSDPNDAFWLAQIHFMTGHFLAAERLLLHPLPGSHTPLLGPSSSMGEATGILGKGKAKETLAGEVAGGRLADRSLACRYLAAQCLVQREHYEDALVLLGKSNPFGPETSSSSRSGSADGGIKLHSSICHLRGILHLRLSSVLDAKESFMEALTLDVKNYDAFRELIDGKMMTSEEEWSFVNKLAYRPNLTEEQAHFVKLVYISRLRKETRAKEIEEARNELSTDYELSENCDILLGLAEEQYSAYKWQDCYKTTSKILERVPAHQGALTLHLSCMHHIPRLHSALFLFAHDLVEQDPAAATSWYAVGLWYFSGKRWAEARPYFAKANLIDQRFAPSWIAFSHSLAFEGEHDAAITAFSTCATLFRGSHLPYLFIGKEHLQLANISLAKDWLLAAQNINATDPLVLNELGVVAYNQEDYTHAVSFFRRAITGAKEMQGAPSMWASTHCNLGHAYRLLGDYSNAKEAYTHSLRLDPTNHTAHSSLGLIAIHEDEIRPAIRIMHSALSLAPQDPMATVLLEMALKEKVERLGPRTIPGLPAALSSSDFDPFNVPKGNPSFGPLPAEESSNFRAANSAGTTPLLGFDRELRADNVRGVDELGREGSVRRRAARMSAGSIGSVELEDEGEEESMDIGEGSTMDLEED